MFPHILFQVSSFLGKLLEWPATLFSSKSETKVINYQKYPAMAPLPSAPSQLFF